MRNRQYTVASALILAFAATLHALRLIFGWELQLAVYTVPLWFSGLVVLIVGFIAIWGLRSLMRKR